MERASIHVLSQTQIQVWREGMRRVLMLFLLLGPLAIGGFARTDGKDKVQNLRNCLEGFAECDRSLLTSAEAKQIDEMQHERNLWQCLRGYACNHSVLSDTESKEVAEAERLRNLLAFVITLRILNKSLLTPPEVDQAAKLEKELNLLHCKERELVIGLC